MGRVCSKFVDHSKSLMISFWFALENNQAVPPKERNHTRTTQIGRSFCLFGKRRLFAVGGVFCFPGSVFFKIKFCAKQAAGNRRNSAGNRRNFAEAGFSMSECLLRVGVFSCGRRFLGFSAEISAGAFRQKVLPPEGPGMRPCPAIFCQGPRFI